MAKKLPLLISILIFFLSFTLLSQKLDYESLHPWDEAWYASISQNNITHNTLLDMTYNQTPYWDHPPLGFIVMTISYKLFGVSEFATRIPAVIYTSITLALVFWFSYKQKNIWVAINSTLILGSTRWFLLRARTGNLDNLLTLTSLAFFIEYFQGEKNKSGLIKLYFFFALAVLSKTTIAFFLIPLLIHKTISTFKSLSKKSRAHTLILAIFTFTLIYLPWFVTNYLKYGKIVLRRHFLMVGFRSGQGVKITLETIKKLLLYIQSATHKWFKPMMISIPFSLFFHKEKLIFSTLLYLILTGGPFIFSNQTEIWHLIPAIVPASMLVGLLLDKITSLFFRKKKIVRFALSLFIFAIASISWKDIAPEIYPSEKRVSDAHLLGQSAKRYSGILYLGDLVEYSPTIAFYSDRYFEKIVDYKNAKTTPEFKYPYSIIQNQDSAKSFIYSHPGCEIKITSDKNSLIHCQ